LDGPIGVRGIVTRASGRARESQQPPRVGAAPGLRIGELAELRWRDVFPTSTGGPLKPSNVRNRILKHSIKRANKRLVKAGLVPLPEGLSPHKLRHTYTSLMVALGTDPGAIMDQTGHTDPGFALGVYRHAMRRDQASKDRLRALVGAEAQAALSGTNGQNGGAPQSGEGHAQPAKTLD
jgi:integrase